MIMAYLPNGTLQDRLDKGHPIPWREAVDIGIKLGRALQVAHDNSIIHRDLKPSNILLASDNEPQLADFGIARRTNVRDITRTHPAFTLFYAAPEVLENGPIGPATDIYSLAATLFALIVGVPAFSDPPPETVAASIYRVLHEPVPDLLRQRGVPDIVWRVISRSMSKQPGNRPTSTSDFAAFLDQAVHSETPPRQSRYTADEPHDVQPEPATSQQYQLPMYVTATGEIGRFWCNAQVEQYYSKQHWVTGGNPVIAVGSNAIVGAMLGRVLGGQIQKARASRLSQPRWWPIGSFQVELTDVQMIFTSREQRVDVPYAVIRSWRRVPGGIEIMRGTDPPLRVSSSNESDLAGWLGHLAHGKTWLPPVPLRLPIEKGPELWVGQDARFRFGLPAGWQLFNELALRGMNPPGVAGAFSRRGSHSYALGVSEFNEPGFGPEWIGNAGELAGYLASVMAGQVVGQPMHVEVAGDAAAMIQVLSGHDRQWHGLPGSGLCPPRTVIFMVHQTQGFLVTYDHLPITAATIPLESDTRDLNTALATWSWGF
jgi:hypothetical protein